LSITLRYVDPQILKYKFRMSEYLNVGYSGVQTFLTVNMQSYAKLSSCSSVYPQYIWRAKNWGYLNYRFFQRCSYTKASNWHINKISVLSKQIAVDMSAICSFHLGRLLLSSVLGLRLIYTGHQTIRPLRLLSIRYDTIRLFTCARELTKWPA